jgi:hypothetical protein
MRRSATLVLAVSLVALACGDDEPGNAANEPLTESKVIAVFLEYACPGAPGLAQALYRPFAQETLEQGTWVLRTAEGQFRFSESARTFETDPESTAILDGLRAKDECRANQ